MMTEVHCDKDLCENNKNGKCTAKCITFAEDRCRSGKQVVNLRFDGVIKMGREVSYCFKCDYMRIMKRLYMRDPDKKHAFVPIGWLCQFCGHIKLNAECIQNDSTENNVYNTKSEELMYTINLES